MRTLFVDEHHHHSYEDEDILKVSNFLSEFDTDIKRAIVRENLGIQSSSESSEYTLEELDTFITKVNNDLVNLETKLLKSINDEIADRQSADSNLNTKIMELNPDLNGGGASLLWVTNNFLTKGNYLTEEDAANIYATSNDLDTYKLDILSEITNKNYLTSIPDEYITETELTAALNKISPVSPSGGITDVYVDGESVVENGLAQIDLSDYAKSSDIKIKSIKVGGEEVTPKDGVVEIPSSGSGLTAQQSLNLSTLNTWVNSGKQLTTIDFTQDLADNIHTHDNMSILNGITQAKIDKWDSNSGSGLTDAQTASLAKLDTLTNLDTLSKIKSSDVTNWNSLATLLQTLSTLFEALQQENADLKSQNAQFTVRIAQAEADIEALLNGETPETVDVLTGISVDKPLIELTIGDTVPSISVTGTYSQSGNKSITLSDCTIISSDANTVSWNNGIVVKKAGSAVLTITYNGKSCYTSVVVKAQDVPTEVVLTSLTSSPTSITRNVGSNAVSVAFTAHYSDNTTQPVTSVTCSSDNSTVAKWENNKITIGEEGSAILTFTYEGKQCQIAVNVNPTSSSEPTVYQYVGYARTADRIFLNEECKVESVEGTWNSSNTQWLDPEETKHYGFIITTEDVKSIGTIYGDFTLSDLNKGTLTDDSGNVYTVYRTDRLSDNSGEIIITLN